MLFDPENDIVKLCAHGMALEGEGKSEEASGVFMKAWNEATNDVEKFTAAHYVARHQHSVADKLIWDKKALEIALNIEDEQIQSMFPSLYLNIAKCYEDLNDYELAGENYQSAILYSNQQPDTGYNHMIKGGILNGIKRLDTYKTNFKDEESNT
ncbi:MAG: rRNA adenine methyltransferase [Saprospiraceae bacterium]